MNTKYKKVATSDRLPNETDYFITENGELQFNIHDQKFWLEGTHEMHPYWWLEEVPDYEDEMREMLEDLVKSFDSCVGYGHPASDRAKELLIKTKQQ